MMAMTMMMKPQTNVVTLTMVLFFTAVVTTHAYVAPPSSASPSSMTRPSSSPLHMVPKYDGSRWIPTTFPDDVQGYPKWHTLLLHGPRPYYERVFKADEYEQAVLKFMAVDGVSRNEAQGNMDAYLRNPNDWAFDRMEAQKRGVKLDYVTLDPKAIVLTLVWSTIVFAVLGRAIVALSSGTNFWAFGPFV
jgi:hypothetical protein